MTRILVVDSGYGGLTVLREIRALLPAADLIYLADDAAFPYGDWEETALTTHIIETVSGAIADHAPDCVVIACNTASTLVLPGLRARFSLPVVGTVPAIKPAAAATRSGSISVLATPGTVRRDYTRALIEEFAPGTDVTLVGAPHLANLAERHLHGEPIADTAISGEIAPCFVERPAGRTDHVVLACTHFPLLRHAMNRLAPWPVTWIDPAPAIARRVEQVLDDPGDRAAGSQVFLRTSGAVWTLPEGAIFN
ncbi:MAG: glutamate racemase [Pseudomonadota bacterium]